LSIFRQVAASTQDARKRNAAATEVLPGHGKAIGRLPLSKQVPIVPLSRRRVSCISYVSRSLAAGPRCRWRRCGCAGCVWLRWCSVVAAGAGGAGGRLVPWLRPKEPHSVAGVSGGRGGSPAAVPERWSVARACGGAPEPRLRESRHAGSARPGQWPGRPVRCGQARARAAAAGGARAGERASGGDGGRAAAGRGRHGALPARTPDDQPTQGHWPDVPARAADLSSVTAGQWLFLAINSGDFIAPF